MNILIIGSEGFIGTHLENFFSKKGYHVYGIDIIPSVKNNHFNYDVRIPLPIEKFKNKIDLIVNLAAVLREPGHLNHEFYETNVLGAKNICLFAEKINCNHILFTSTMMVYGNYDFKKDEDTFPSPTSPYGNSKLVAEEIHKGWQLKNPSKRKLIITRPGVVFGDGENGNVSRLIKLVKNYFFFYSSNKNIYKAGIYINEFVDVVDWSIENQIRGSLSNSILYNAVYWPNSKFQDYVNSINIVLKRKPIIILNLPFKFLLILSHLIGLFKVSDFSPLRIKKLRYQNFIYPKFLLQNKYKFKFNLIMAFKDWSRKEKNLWK